VKDGTIASWNWTPNAQQFDATRGELSGDPVEVSEDVGLFTVSSTGTLVSRQTSAEQTRLTWFDRGGKPLGTLGPVGDYSGIQLSPDNTRLAAVQHRVPRQPESGLLAASRTFG